jgi:hypothetical protein
MTSPARFAIPVAAALALGAVLALPVLALPAFAQSVARPRPPGTVPLDELPPPPPAPLTTEPQPEPQVTTRAEPEQTVQEYRIKNRLYMMRVTPKHGHPYVLMDMKGDGTFIRQDNPLDNGVRVPQWVLLEF